MIGQQTARFAMRALLTLFAATAVATTVATPAYPQSLDTLLEEQLKDQLVRQVETRIVERIESAIESKIDEELTQNLPIDAALGAVEEILPNRDAPFASGVDDLGRDIEANVWVILATPAQSRWIAAQGWAVLEQRKLLTVGKVLLRVEVPPGWNEADAIQAWSEAHPAGAIDRNHLYRPEAGTAAPLEAAEDAQAPATAAPARVRWLGTETALGIVDSAVAAKHEAFRDGELKQKSFVSYRGKQSKAHGTAVASLLVGNSKTMRGSLPGGPLKVASVFFEDRAGSSAATTAGLVQALDWLVVEGVGVINMSLTGPPNRVLEEAILALHRRGIWMVAAVGNEGPAAPVLYPAAYEAVIGVTALDDEDVVYRYANRGPQVRFAALGVNVTVARPGGGYDRESGTSMASPRVAAEIYRARIAGGRQAEEILAALRASAVDLGEPGFDEVYGYGGVGGGFD